ncbi:hypothetical protein [Streptomyces sp. NPDC006368]|uniref:hypothetical protein n=1 Tax=Streptomyces sp. NPDC006368 TaxID=3156760 RepID=UPI0033AC738E
MNQVGDKPEEVRKRLEEEKRQAPNRDRDRDRKPSRPGEPEGAASDDDMYDTYEEPEDRP